MALIYFVKRALGFDNTADDTDEDIDNPFKPVAKPSDNTAAATDAASPDPSGDAQSPNIENDMTDDSDTALPLVDASLPGCIFDSVIRLFNRTMPDFVRECLDTDSQRQYLFHAIESDVRRQMIRVVDEVRLNACKPSETKMLFPTIPYRKTTDGSSALLTTTSTGRKKPSNAASSTLKRRCNRPTTKMPVYRAKSPHLTDVYAALKTRHRWMTICSRHCSDILPTPPIVWSVHIH